MAKGPFVFQQFTGMDSLTDPVLLPPNRASFCRNVEFDTGSISAIPRLSLPLWTPDQARSFALDTVTTAKAETYIPFGTGPARKTEQVYTSCLFSANTKTFVVWALSYNTAGMRFNAAYEERLSFPAPTVIGQGVVSGGGTIPEGDQKYAITSVRHFYDANFNFLFEQESEPTFSGATIGSGQRPFFEVLAPDDIQAVRFYRLYNGEYRRVGEFIASAPIATGNGQATDTVSVDPGLRPGSFIKVTDPNDATLKVYRYKGTRFLDQGTVTFAASPGSSAAEVEVVFTGTSLNAAWEYIENSSTYFYDNNADSSLGSVLPSYFQAGNGDIIAYEYLDSSVADPHAIINGSLFLVYDSELFVSIAGQFHAYPTQYRRQFKSPINAVWGQQGNVYVGLDSGEIYVAAADDPLYASYRELAGEIRRFFTRNLFPYKGGVAYVDNKSALVFFDGASFREVFRYEDRTLELVTLASTSRDIYGVFGSYIDDTVYFDAQMPGYASTDAADPLSFYAYHPDSDTRTLFSFNSTQQAIARGMVAVSGVPHYLAPTATLNVFTRWPLYNVSPMAANVSLDSCIWRSGRIPIEFNGLGQATELRLFGRSLSGTITFKLWFDYADPKTDTPEITATLDLTGSVESNKIVKLPSLKQYEFFMFELEFEADTRTTISQVVVV